MIFIRMRADARRPYLSSLAQALLWLGTLTQTAGCSGADATPSPENGSGGETASGGATNTGGAQPNPGGSTATGGVSGAQATGGVVGGGGAPASGGTAGASTSAGSGGNGATGGSAGAPSALTALCQIALTCSAEIEDEPKQDCLLRITDPAGVQLFMDHAGVELRGRSSLRYPKLNYGVELRNAAGAESPVAMMGMGKESDWIFDGSWVDRSFLRNDLVFGLFRDLGHYAAESRACMLSLNGQSQGIYRLTEKIKRDDDRVALPLDDGSGTSFIISQDNDGNLTFPTGNATGSGTWQLVYPKQSLATATQLAAVQAWLDGLRAALNGDDPGNATTGVFSYLDLAGTVDFILLEEFAKNIDGYNLSLNLFKAPGTPAKFIPWDFDLAFGQPTVRNATSANEAPEGWVYNRTQFITALTRIPAIPAGLGPRWRQLRAGPFSDAAILAKLDELQSVFDATSLSTNFTRWPINEVDFTPIYRPYSLYAVSSYDEEVQHLRTWITIRLAWLDAHIDSYPN